MRASSQEQISAAGVNEVCARFELLNWGPVPNSDHDLGTDLLVQARDSRSFDRGLLVGVQVKTGPSYFERPLVENASTVGWWYYESTADHFDDWVVHTLPHLIVLHELGDGVSYWAHVTAERVESTGQGCKILVPATQQLNDENRDQLLAIAATRAARHSLEGTSFRASARSVAPGRRLRYSLLVPRLVAPHPNAGYQNSINPEQAIALCAQGRARAIKHFAEAHDSVIDPAEDYQGPDWRWRFLRALWQWTVEGHGNELDEVFERAPTPPFSAAAGVVLACSEFRSQHTTRALQVLDRLVGDDQLGPVDHGWVLVQRSRLRSELGDVDGARLDAKEAQRAFIGDLDDITASALAGAAAWQLYVAGGGNAGLGDALTATDNAASWWQSQVVARSLSDLVDAVFGEWARDGRSHGQFENTMLNGLIAAELHADLLGDHGYWRASSSLRAKCEVLDLRQPETVAVSADVLQSFRMSGDYDSSRMVVRQLGRCGPTAPLVETLRQMEPGAWTRSSTLATLHVLTAGGEFLPLELADEWVSTLVDVMAEPSAFKARFQPTFAVDHTIANAICGILPSASGARRRSVLDHVLSRDHPLDESLGQAASGWFREIGPSDLEPEDVDRLLTAALTDDKRFGSTALGWCAKNGSGPARDEMLRRALHGDPFALAGLGSIAELSPHHASALIEYYGLKLRDHVDGARSGRNVLEPIDPIRSLAAFNLHFSQAANWDPLLQALGETQVLAGLKRGAMELISELVDKVPPEIREELVGTLDSVASSATRSEWPSWEEPLGGVVIGAAIALGSLPEKDHLSLVSRLATGDLYERRDACAIVGRGYCSDLQPLLVTLLSDPEPGVRQAAALAIGRCASTAQSTDLMRAMAREAAERDGTLVPSAVLLGLDYGSTTSLLIELAETAVQHPSSRVRSLAQKMLRPASSAPQP